MTDHVENRERVIQALRQEMVGPAPSGDEIDLGRGPVIDDPKRWYGPYRQQGSGEEILTRDSPTKRYGTGVLFPWRSQIEETVLGEDSADSDTLADMAVDTADIAPEIDTGGEFRARGKDVGPEEFDISAANSYQPSSMGVSFLADLSGNTKVAIEASGGRYRRTSVTLRKDGKDARVRDWWYRIPVKLSVEIPADMLLGTRPVSVISSEGLTPLGVVVTSENFERLDVQVEVFSRPNKDGTCLLTICLVNRTRPASTFAIGEYALFQSYFRATVVSRDLAPRILPYPAPDSSTDLEQAGLEMLYRHAPAFATGHGCAADWERESENPRATAVTAECLPQVQLPAITPDIRRKEDGSPLVVSMASLINLAAGGDAWRTLEDIIERYEAWIGDQRARLNGDAALDRYRLAAEDHLKQCERVADRMRGGLDYLARDANALHAFRLANEAILLQQIATRDAPRPVAYDKAENRIVVEGTFEPPETKTPPTGRGNWYAFQIAFLLASVESTGNPRSSDRELVELIWFPTGGGKTEAYLGLAAFGMFKRRLNKPSDAGVHVLMRYTLRLLTTQQFERASSLICAMERLRKREPDALGETSFSIGIWLGGETTPNRRSSAVKEYNDFKANRIENPFLLNQCPWCGAAFTRLEASGRNGKKRTTFTPGYRLHQDPRWPTQTVRFYCPDSSCPFSEGLPIHLVDEDIYADRPTLVIGTIDKFALLAWREDSRAIFGIDRAGKRFASPPGIVIQDELHLISGPLGSVAGLFETVIEALCTDERDGEPIRPKIVSSTATIRRYHDQIRALYARDRVCLFPPPGLDAGDSFFAVYEKESAGRVYVGVHAPSLGSVQTEWVRAFTALMQAPMALAEGNRDPWWTMLIFFNSIREMGTAHTLFDSDVRDYFGVVWQRANIPRERRRYLNRPLQELTGGLRRSEIKGAMDDLKLAIGSPSPPVDVCLASNIIEVGIDIPRLALMVVAGQPKTTAQYIQVTGRVGRQRGKPGLVVTLYSPSKPRDRSHFERFRGYHERLYAQVEPTSVTPFSAPALDRVLHATLVAYARQQGDVEVARSPWPYPKDLLDRMAFLLRRRVELVDASERKSLERFLELRVNEWRGWQRDRWDDSSPGEDTPLLRTAGAYSDPEEERLSWPTMRSMRNVDAECEGEITTRYIPDFATESDTDA